MMLTGEDDSEQDDQETRTWDLLYGITPYHVRILCESEWNGGYGMTPGEVGDLTLDQIFMLFARKKSLRRKGRVREDKLHSMQATTLADDEGYIRGRAADGTKIRAKITGESLASRLAREEKEKAKKSAKRMRKGKNVS